MRRATFRRKLGQDRQAKLVIAWPRLCRAYNRISLTLCKLQREGLTSPLALLQGRHIHETLLFSYRQSYISQLHTAQQLWQGRDGCASSANFYASHQLTRVQMRRLRDSYSSHYSHVLTNCTGCSRHSFLPTVACAAISQAPSLAAACETAH